jgi:hypothetical protein
MADIISRLKLESGEFDSKIKRAGQELIAYSEHCRKTGLQMGFANKDARDFAQSLGNMQTTSTTARGKISELSDAFVNLRMMYKQMTDEEKNNQFGKNLAASLDKLKIRIQDAKKDLADVTTELNGKASGGGLFGGGKLDGMLQVFGGNLMTKGAGMLAGLASEMGDMVKQGVELAKQGEGIRIAFERLGRGDILDGLRQATHGTVTDIELMKAAVKFNDFKLPLDELGTMLAFAQQKAKDTGQSVDYMVDSIVTGLGRKSLMILDNLGLSATEVKDKMKETGDMTKAVGAIIREQMAKAGDYVETAADRAAQANVSLQNKMEELGRKFAPLEEASNSLWTSMKIGILDIVGGPLAQLLNGLTQAGRMANAYGKMGGSGKVGRMTANLAGASEQNRQSIYQQQQQQFWRYINPREQQIRDIRAWQSGQRGEALQGRIGAIRDKYGSLDATKIQAEVDAAKKMLADYQAAAKQILQPIEQKIVPTFGGGSGGGGKSGKSGSSKGFDISSIAFDANKAGLAAAMSNEEPSEIWKAITEGAKESKSSVDELTAALEALNKAEGVTVKDTKKDSKELGKNWQAAGSAILAVGSAMSQIEDPAAKVVGTVAQAIATIALTFASSLKGTVTPWDWIAAVAAGTATMLTTISAIHSATGYAQGGMIKGNSYSGDNIGGMVDGGAGGFVGLNAGEVVLNRAQTGNLASQLQGNGFGNARLVGRLKGRDILISIDRELSATGKGQLATWK